MDEPLLVIEGAAGQGKSRLAARLSAESPVAVRALVRCLGLPAEPYVVLRELARELADCDPAPVLAALDRADSDYLICLALREVLAAQDGVLLVLDDLDQADRDSRRVLRCLATRLPPGVRVVATCAPGGLGRRWAGGHRVRLAEPEPPVRVAALLRGRFSARLPALVCGITQAQAEAGLERAAAAGLLTAGQDYEFWPPLARTLADTMSAAERRRTHQAIAKVLDQDDLPELIHHHRAAGDLAAAARQAERAADRAIRAGRPTEAVGLLRELLGEPALPQRVRAALANRLGRLTQGSRSCTDTVPLLRGLLAEDRLPVGVRGELRLHLGLRLANQAGDADAGRAEVERAVPELRRRPLLAARAISALALPHLGSAPVAEHLRWLAQLAAVPERGDPALRTGIAVNRATALLQLGDPSAWNLLPSTGPGLELLRGNLNFADAAITLGRHRAAAELLATAAALPVTDAPHLRQWATGNQLRLDLATGNWPGLAERVRAHLAAGPHSPRSAAESRLLLSRLAFARGEWAEAADLLDGAGWCGFAVPAAAATGLRLATAQDRPADLAATLAPVRRKGVWVWAAELVDAGVETLLHQGDPAAAAALLAEFEAGITGRDCPLGQAVLKYGQGLLDHDAELLATAAAEFAALPRPYEQARATESLARLLFATGERALAGQHSAEAAGIFHRLGASWDAARCDRLRREHGGARGGGPGRRGYGGALSPREHEVARLIGSGRTNREIAELLFLSPRTVERHVASLLRKLGARGRAEVGQLSPR